MELMRRAKPGMYEFEFESLFHHLSYSNGGCREFAYTPICASGPNAAILHYGHAVSLILMISFVYLIVFNFFSELSALGLPK